MIAQRQETKSKSAMNSATAMSATASNQPKTYPAGALVRAADICRNTKTGQPGLLPINRATWYRWIREGRVPQARYLTPSTPVWPVEQVLALAMPEE